MLDTSDFVIKRTKNHFQMIGTLKIDDIDLLPKLLYIRAQLFKASLA